MSINQEDQLELGNSQLGLRILSHLLNDLTDHEKTNNRQIRNMQAEEFIP